jgi:hypothetical protein
MLLVAFPSIMNRVALLEYQCVAQDLFVDVHMNAELHFCRENIDSLKKFIQSKIQYFDRAEKTDRTAGKAKKMGVRELLKAGSSTKTTGDGND